MEKEQKSKKPILTDEQIKKRKSKKTKTAVAAFVLILGVGVMGNWYYQNSDFSSNIKPLISASGTKTLGEAELVDAKAEIADDSESKYFSEARIERENSRDKALDTLKDSLTKADGKELETVQKQIAEISNSISIENKIENLVKAKGISNCLAVIDCSNKKVSIIVECDELENSIIMQIKEIAMEQASCEFKDITIIQSNT